VCLLPHSGDAQALQGKDITIYGNGKATRSFQYVDDLVAGLMALMEGDYAYPVNLGNPSEYTIRQFAELITEITNSTSKIVHLPVRAPSSLLPPWVAQGFPMLPLEGLCSKLPLELMAHISAMSRVHIWRSYLLLLAFCAACLLVGFALTLLVQVRFLWLSLARTYAS